MFENFLPFNDYIDKVCQLLICKLEILGVIVLLCMSKALVVIHKLSIDGDSKFVSKSSSHCQKNYSHQEQREMVWERDLLSTFALYLLPMLMLLFIQVVLHFNVPLSS